MADRPLRLLMRPEGKGGAGVPVHGFRWVAELNGHPGACAPDHWHPTPEQASACFHGEPPESTEPAMAAPANTRRAT